MRKSFTYCLFFLVSTSLAAQVPFFQSYSLLRKKDVLHVNDILQDRDGYIWLGTSSGLFRFDGRQHIQYTVKDSLPDNDVTALAQDSVGRIWTGHRNGAMTFFENGVFRIFEPEEGNSSEPISDIAFARNGDLWFSTFNDGLYRYCEGRLYRFDEQDGMPDLYVYDIMEDSNGNVLAGTDGGIVVCHTSASKVSLSVLNYKTGLPDNIIRKIIEGENQTLWIATEDAGIIRFDPASKTYTSISEKWPYGPVADFVIKGDEIWAACPQTGLLIYDLVTNEARLFGENVVPGTMSLNVVLLDVEGNIWAGSRTGLIRTPGTGVQFIDGFTSRDGANILAVTCDHQNNLWYSSKDGLFRRSTNASGETQESMPLARSRFGKYTVISLFTDGEGYVWAGLYGEGVLRIHPVTGKITHLNNELRNGNILSITGKGNVIWLATLGGGSKLTIRGETISVENVGRAEGLSSDFIYQVFIDDKDRIWFATDGKGVDMMDASGFHHYEKGLPTRIIYSITQAGDKRIWVNAQSNGLLYFDEATGIFRPTPAFMTMREPEVHSLHADRNGNLVVLHDLGIDIIETENESIRYLGDETGLRDRVGNLNTFGRDVQGNLYFGTSSGIIKYAVRDNHLNKAPVPQIGEVKVFDKAASAAKVSSLSYDENNLTFHFTGLWYQNPENVHFSYKLENYDRDWIATRNTSVTYSHLPPGKYVFQVKASVTEDFSRAKIASINIVVYPPFWKTPSFYMLSIFLLIVSVYAFVKFRERKLLRDKMMLEATVRRRTMEVQRQNDEIQAQNEEIMAQAEEIKGINENLEQLVFERTNELERKNRALEEYAFINAHKLRSPVASILGLINLISKTSLDEEGREINKRLHQSAEELDEIVRSITKAIEKGEKQPFR
jgi:ligand-binding sensor domain-containing protein